MATDQPAHQAGRPGLWGTILGLHMYTWALITFVIVLVYCGAMLMLMPKSIPVAPPAGSRLYLVSTIIVWVFIGLVAANVVAIFVLEGFAWVLPDDPTSYHLFDS